MVDLRKSLSAAEQEISRHLDEMHACGQFILGPQTARFEREFAAAMGGVDGIGVGSGTAAIELCLRGAGIAAMAAGGAPCEVIVPGMTSMFTALAVVATGARIRVADVSPDTLLLTPESVDRAWTPATRAVIAVHLYGQPCRLAELAALCQERGAVLIQDACQAHGATSKGFALTHYSPYCAYSFYPTKNLGCLGDGGAIVTSDPAVAERLRQWRDGGRRGDQICRLAGMNSRLDEMQACYLRGLLPLLADGNSHRRLLASRYRELLAPLSHLPFVGWDEDSVHHLLVVRSGRRDELRGYLGECGVQTGVHYPVAIHQQPGLLPYASWAEEPAHSAAAAREVLSLPIGPHVTEEQVDQIAGVLGAWS
jgi:dTDP-3-amino-3,4,6-trideoxy-alpha-D-glucose transaminase